MTQGLLVVVLADPGQHPLLMSFVLIPAWVNLTDESVKIGVWPQGPLGNELFATCGTFFVAGQGQEGSKQLLTLHQ